MTSMSRQSYAKWEQGENVPDIDKCNRLAQFYEITIDALIHQENTVGNTRLAPAPPGKHLWGTVTIGAYGMTCTLFLLYKKFVLELNVHLWH